MHRDAEQRQLQIQEAAEIDRHLLRLGEQQAILATERRLQATELRLQPRLEDLARRLKKLRASGLHADASQLEIEMQRIDFKLMAERERMQRQVYELKLGSADPHKPRETPDLP